MHTIKIDKSKKYYYRDSNNNLIEATKFSVVPEVNSYGFDLIINQNIEDGHYYIVCGITGYTLFSEVKKSKVLGRLSDMFIRQFITHDTCYLAETINAYIGQGNVLGRYISGVYNTDNPLSISERIAEGEKYLMVLYNEMQIAITHEISRNKYIFGASPQKTWAEEQYEYIKVYITKLKLA